MLSASVWLLELYSGLAEVLAAETRWPEWFCKPGREWPLWLPATHLAGESYWPELSHTVTMMADVPVASQRKRRGAYDELIKGNGYPPMFLYESQYLNGRILGPEAHTLAALYPQFGLEVEGAELPDHAAIELEFIAFLIERELSGTANKQDWKRARKLFVEQHAGRWLPDVGRRLTKSSDPAWAVIGHLLTAVFSSPKKDRSLRTTGLGTPQIINEDSCSLCGFCTQVCPTRALKIQEDVQMTRLYLEPRLCVHCQKCDQVCEENAIKLNQFNRPQERYIILRQSPRAICPNCHQATVSQAELAAIAARLEHHPDWLDYCLDCRVMAV